MKGRKEGTSERREEERERGESVRVQVYSSVCAEFVCPFLLISCVLSLCIYSNFASVVCVVDKLLRLKTIGMLYHSEIATSRIQVEPSCSDCVFSSHQS